MLFTDDDLNRFKKCTSDYLKHGQNGAGSFPVQGVQALLARLEAAEYALIRYAVIPDERLTSGIREAVNTWRKAAGK